MAVHFLWPIWLFLLADMVISCGRCGRGRWVQAAIPTAAIPTTAIPTTAVPTTAPDPHLMAKSASDSTYRKIMDFAIKKK